MPETGDRIETEQGPEVWIGEAWYVVASFVEEAWRRFASRLEEIWRQLIAPWGVGDLVPARVPPSVALDLHGDEPRIVTIP